MAGRPTKMTEATAAVVLGALGAGAGRAAALASARISPDTFARWYGSDALFAARVVLAERTPERRQKILAAIGSGAPRRTACRYSGLDESGFNDWLADDITMTAAVQSAEGAAEVARIAQIADAGRGGQVVKRSTTTTRRRDGSVETKVDEQFSAPQWTTAAWWLERVHADDWSKRDKLDLEVYVRERARELGLDEDEAVRQIKPKLRLVS